MPNETARTGRPYGWRARLGLIVPPTNTINEAEWNLALPDGFSVHTARMALHLDSASPAGHRQLLADLAIACKDLAAADVDAIAYGCTAGSLGMPLDRITAPMTAFSKKPAAATAPAIAAALGALGAVRIALATPYYDALNAHEAAFFSECGFTVASVKGLGLGAAGLHAFAEIAKVSFADTFALARDAILACGSKPAALVLSCTDLATLKIHEDLERAFGIPVVSSNQATLWATLRAAGCSRFDDFKWGRLFADAQAAG